MKRHYFLGLAAGMRHRWMHVLAIGRKQDVKNLQNHLKEYYNGRAIATKNGRSALCLALKAYLDRGDYVLINGFTCYAVVEAVKAAGMVPVFADIDEDTLDFTTKTLERAIKRTLKANPETKISGVVVQNTLGTPVDIQAIERFATNHKLVIIEDLAHSVGVEYADGREIGKVGAAAVLSFGKDKVIDTTSGGAVVLRDPCKHRIEAPSILPKKSDRYRARFYPMLASWCRHLTRIHLGGILMRFFIRTHLVERSADNRLDLLSGIAPFEARLALKQLQQIEKVSSEQIRDYYLVSSRDKVLEKLREAGYYFDGLWYEKPVSPERYYKEVDYPEKDCPVAVRVASEIVNLPRYYSDEQLKEAKKIIKRYERKAVDEG